MTITDEKTINQQNDRKEWIESLEEGDTVLANSNEPYRTVKIKTITEKGNIELEDGELLSSNGYITRNATLCPIIYNIQPITPEIQKSISDREKKKLNKKVADLKFEKAKLSAKFSVLYSDTKGQLIKDLDSLIETLESAKSDLYNDKITSKSGVVQLKANEIDVQMGRLDILKDIKENIYN